MGQSLFFFPVFFTVRKYESVRVERRFSFVQIFKRYKYVNIMCQCNVQKIFVFTLHNKTVERKKYIVVQNLSEDMVIVNV